MWKRSFITVGSAIVFSLHACSEPRTQVRLSAEDPAAHWVYNDQLIVIMNEMAREALTDWPQEIQRDVRRERFYADARTTEEVERLSGALAKAAGVIPQTIASTEMFPEDRNYFLALVDKLESQALELKQTTAQGRLERVRPMLDRISDTCNSCHARFHPLTDATNRP